MLVPCLALTGGRKAAANDGAAGYTNSGAFLKHSCLNVYRPARNILTIVCVFVCVCVCVFTGADAGGSGVSGGEQQPGSEGGADGEGAGSAAGAIGNEGGEPFPYT